jgi:hypothetical protein
MGLDEPSVSDGKHTPIRRIKCISKIGGKLTPSSVTATHARQSSAQCGSYVSGFTYALLVAVH